MPYGPDHAEVYDAVFRSRGKDFEAEAEQLGEIVRQRCPEAASLLDVACGTGAHLARYAKLFEHVEGVELAPAMCSIARERLPEVDIHQDDMHGFDLPRTFDTVVCLGNVVACTRSAEELDEVIARMAAHLNTGGVLIAEPWWFPESFIDGYVGGHVLAEPSRVISRVTRSVRQGMRTHMEINFVVAEPSGIRQWTDILDIGLYEHDQYVAAFERAGLTVELLEPFALTGSGRSNAPGIFVGVSG